jgi:PAS domain S-box-containing protein
MGILFYTGLEERKRNIEHARKEVTLIAHAMANAQKDVTHSVYEILSTLALTAEVQALDIDAVNDIFKKLMKRNPAYRNIVLIDLNGNVLTSGIPSAGVNLADRKHFIDALKTRDFAAGEYITIRINDFAPAFPFAYPVLDATGTEIAVLAVPVNLAQFDELYQQANFPQGSFVAVTDQKGTRLLYYPEKVGTNPVGTTIRTSVWQVVNTTQTPGVITSPGSDGINQIIAYEQVQLNDSAAPYMYVWAGVPEDFVLAPANIILKRNLLLLLLVTVGSLILAWSIGRRAFITPIHQLIGITREFAKGNLESKVEMNAKIKEFERLTNSFYAMANALSTSQRKLQESEDTFRRLFEDSSDPILLLDNSGVFIECNQAALVLLKMKKEQLIHLTPAEIAPEFQPHGQRSTEVASEMISLAYSQGLHQFEWTCVNSEGGEFIIAVSLVPITIRGQRMLHNTWRDITESKRIEKERIELQTQLTQKHKMEAVGYLAGGMAHNFNNNLSIILGNIELSLLKIQNPKVHEHLKNAKIGIMRSRDLVKKIITYSRKGIQAKAPIQLLNIVDETITLLRSTLPVTIHLHKSIKSTEGTGLIFADASQIQEVLINLCNNAVHAMNEKGELDISLESATLEEKDIPSQYEATPGLYVKLSVKDTGCGIPIEIRDKIFDPFYTTREAHEGVGMGLATVQGIVAQHGGIIKFYSVLNQGTEFNLYFPIVEMSEAEQQPMNSDIPKGTEQILFVDDDAMLATLGGEILSEMGYQVTTMTESSKAITLFSTNPEHFNLVITDQTMPNISGKELIEKLKKIRPDLRTILCTGYSSQINAEDAIQLGINAFCLKPLNIPELLQTVRRVLDE